MNILRRIVLSALLLSACDFQVSADDEQNASPSADDEAKLTVMPDGGSSSDGIGTSPSATCRPDIWPCGVWVDTDSQAADRRSLACSPPDVVVYTAGHTSCGHALLIADTIWPGRAFVRRVTEQLRATEATCP